MKLCLMGGLRIDLGIRFSRINSKVSRSQPVPKLCCKSLTRTRMACLIGTSAKRWMKPIRPREKKGLKSRRKDKREQTTQTTSSKSYQLKIFRTSTRGPSESYLISGIFSSMIKSLVKRSLHLSLKALITHFIWRPSTTIVSSQRSVCNFSNS